MRHLAQTRGKQGVVEENEGEKKKAWLMGKLNHCIWLCFLCNYKVFSELFFALLSDFSHMSEKSLGLLIHILGSYPTFRLVLGNMDATICMIKV